MNNKVLVIGAGPCGLCLSLALARRGIEVDVIERQESGALEAPAFDGREIALTHSSMRLLRELDVWRHVPADGIAPINRARIMDGADPGFAVDGAAFGHDQLGVFVSNQHLRAAAWQAVAEEGRIRVHTGAAVESVGSDVIAARVGLADGRTLEAPLLVAADSRYSEARRAMGIQAHMHDFGKTMLVCRVHHSQSSAGTAWEWFGQGQTRALLPLGEHVSSVVMTVPGVEAQTLLQMSPEAFAAEVAARYEGRLGAVELASTRHGYPLVATWARRFVAQRFALAGDAAVGMHPVTAHGFNLGLASIAHLAQAAGDGLERFRDPGHPALLARYQRRHRAGSALLFAGTQAVAGIFSDEHLLLRPLRRAVLGAGRRLPVLRRALVAGLVDETARPLPLASHVALGVKVLRPRLRRERVESRAQP